MQPPEQFLLRLTRVPHYAVCVRAMALENEFDDLYKDSRESVDIFTSLYQTVESSNGLLVLLALVREIGNFVNHGGFAGGAPGFALASVLKLADVKGKDGVHLLHFVAREMNDRHQAALKDLEVRGGGAMCGVCVLCICVYVYVCDGVLLR